MDLLIFITFRMKVMKSNAPFPLGSFALDGASGGGGMELLWKCLNIFPFLVRSIRKKEKNNVSDHGLLFSVVPCVPMDYIQLQILILYPLDCNLSAVRPPAISGPCCHPLHVGEQKTGNCERLIAFPFPIIPL
jgi:hypothetical protein